MNNLRNSVRLIGNLGAKPEVKELADGKMRVKISLATNDKYKDADGKTVTETQWHNLVAWGKQAEFANNYLDKGNEIAVEGKLVNRSYTDKDGNKKYITEITVNDLIKLGPAKAQE